MGLQIRRRSTIKLRVVSTIIAVAALAVQPLYGFVSYQVAHALPATTVAVTPNTLSIDGGDTNTATADASSFTDLKLSFHYNADKLEAGDQLSYGWSAGSGAVTNLGSIKGETGNVEEGDVTDVTLPAGASVSNLTLNFSNTGTGGANDKVTVNNISLTGTPDTPPAPVVKPVENARTHAMFDTIQEAIDDSGTIAGDTIDINQDISVPTQVNVNKSVTIDGQGHTVSVSGTGYRFLITAAGSALQNMNVTKTDAVGEQNIVGIQANNVTIDSVNFKGQFNIGDPEVERALEVSSVSNVTVENSTFENLRQPAYVNTATGTFANNYTSDTKGWVLVADSNIHFTGNRWGTNVTDIAIIDSDNNPATPITNNYTCPVMAQIMADNDSATIDNQVMTGSCAVPEVPSNLQVKYQYASDYISNGSVLRTLSTSDPLGLTWSDGASTGVTAHHILVTWPDGSEHTSYQGANTNAWLSKTIYNNGDGFGQHGEGKYTFQVEAINANGATTSTETFSLYYVSHIPTATFAATPPQYVNGDFQVTVIGQDTTVLQSVGADVRDPSDTTGNSYRTGCTNPTLLDGAALPAYSDNGSGVTVKVTCTIKTAGLVNGHTYTLRARAGFKEANGQSYGNSNTDSTWQFTVDRTGPTITIASPATSVVSNMHDLVLSGTVSDPSGVLDLYVRANDAAARPSRVFTGTATLNGSNWTLTVPAGTFQDSHTIQLQVFARDSLHNQSEKDVTFTADNSAPAVPSGLSWIGSNNKSAANGFTNIQKGTLSWKDTTPSDVDHYIYKFWTNIPGYWNDPSHPWTDSYSYVKKTTDGGYVPTDFANKEGTYYFCVAAVDAAGNDSDCSSTMAVTYDITAPTNIAATYTGGLKNVTTPTSVTGAVVGGNLTFQVSEVEQNPSNMYAEIDWLNPATNKWEKHAGWGTTITSDNGTLSLPATAPSGKYQIKVSSIRDAAGNTAPTQTFGFTVDNTPPIAPTITPLSGTNVKGDQTFTVTKSNSGDSLSVISSVGVLADNPDGTYSLDTTAMAKGTSITITATETDGAGNSTVATATYSVENAAPTVSGITMGHDANGQYWLTGSSTNSAGASVSVLNNGVSFASPVAVNADGSWTISLGALPKSTSYNFTVLIKNTLGYSSSLTQTFTTAPLQTSVVTPSVTQGLFRSFATVATPVNTATTPTPAVKGSSNKGILGAQTAKSDKNISDTSVLSPSSQGWKILGFAWYWWLILIAAIVALWYWLAAVRRRRADEAAYLNK